MKIISCLLIIILLVGAIVSFNIHPVKGVGTIYIRADGSIDPPGVPIHNTDNITYTFTGDIFVDAVDGIVVERDDVVIDGDGHTLTSSNESNSIGIYLSGRENVTVRNTQITAFYRGIKLLSSSNNSIIGNRIAGATYEGVRLFSSSNNSIKGNNMADNYYGIWLLSSSNNNSISGNYMVANIYDGIRLFSSSNNSISGNNITANIDNGIMLYYLSKYNSVSENSIANNGLGMQVSGSSDNMIYHNNFVDNSQQALTEETANVWDDGYPSGGNYWNDYVGTDANSDGIGDTPYVLDQNNVDSLPLMHPFNTEQISGDINQDGIVDIFDVTIIALAFSSTPSDPNWNPIADTNSDGIVDIFDLVEVASRFGETG